MNIELLKITMPIVTFFLGVLFSPVAEYWKERFQRKKKIKFLSEEFKDESKWLGERIKKMSMSLDTMEKLKIAQEPSYKTGLYVPRPTSSRFIESVLDSSYIDLSSEKRSTLKSILVQIKGINGSSENMMNLKPEQDQLPEIIKNQKNFIYTACCLRHCMLYFVGDSQLEFIEDIGDKKAIEQQISDLNLAHDYDAIINKKTYKYNMPDKQ